MPKAHRQSAYRKQQADNPFYVEGGDQFGALREKLGIASKLHAEWSGIPIPVSDHEIVVEPSYPYADIFKTKQVNDADYIIRSEWYSKRKRLNVGILESKKKLPGKDHGEIIWGYALQNPIDVLLGTIGASFAWGLQQENTSLNFLKTLVKPHIFKQYLLTGTFLETSERSNITYVFRRLRPTIVLTTKGEQINVLCTLCMHPIGYYKDTWGGAMCPTDDVICHLMLMRGDEHGFWKRCNQHAPQHPNSGLHA